MADTDATGLLRDDLLAGVSLVLAGAPASSEADATAAAIERACTGLGGRVSRCAPASAGGEQDRGEADHDAEVERALAAAGEVQMLVVDAAGIYADAAAGERNRARDALAACLDATWNLTRALADRAFLAPSRPGRIVLVAPAPTAGEHAGAACAGLENLARTLSIEWARRAVTAVAIAPGERTASGELGALTAYLASPAGAYFSGCLLDLRGG